MSGPASALVFLRAFIRARYRWRRGTRAALEAWQRRQLARFTSRTLSRIPFYAGRVQAARDGEAAVTGAAVIDKATFLEHFAALNVAGVTLVEARAVAAAAERSRDFRPTLPGGLTVGLSSGTSGRPGLFLVSPQERAAWAGAVLGTLLTPADVRQLLTPWAPPLRVAFFLRANSNLYATVGGRRLRFTFFDLLRPLDDLRDALGGTQPDMLVAPASTLAALARATRAGTLAIAPRQVVSVAETLEPDDRAVIRQAWQREPVQVYQATEGFLGASCAYGRVHLNEGFVHIEPAWLDASRFVPVVTDFSRRTQAIVRYRLDDVLVGADGPCPCGRPTRAVTAIEGRCDDVLWLRGSDGTRRAVFPDVIRRAMMLAQTSAAGQAFDDYRLTQREDVVEVALHPPAGEAAVAAALHDLWCTQSVAPPGLRMVPWPVDPPGAKRRRIRRAAPEAA